MTVDQVPSFATRSWSDRPWTVGGVRVEIEGTAANQCDLELVATRCKALIRELSIQAGVCGGESDESSTLILPFELSAGPAPTPNVAVYVHGVLRAVTPDDCVVGNQHRTGWALGLDRVESLAVAFVERVLLDDPGLLLQADVPPKWLAAFAPHPDLPVSPAELRALLSRHISLADKDAIKRAFVVLAQTDQHLRVPQLTALLNDLSLVLEVPEDMSDDKAALLLERTVGVVDLMEVVGGTFPIPPTLRRSSTGGLLGGDHARLLMGGLPLGVVGLADGEVDLSAVREELRRASSRTWDQVTTTLRLDRLAAAFPAAVSATRLGLSDLCIAEVLRAAADDLAITDLHSLLDRLVEPFGQPESEVVRQLRRDLVGRHLALFLGESSLVTFVLPAETEHALAAEACSDSPSAVVASVEALLRGAARQLPVLPGIHSWWQSLSKPVRRGGPSGVGCGLRHPTCSSCMLRRSRPESCKALAAKSRKALAAKFCLPTLSSV